MLDKMNVAHTEADTHACNVQSRKRRKDRACGRPAARPAHLFFPKGRKQERKPNERRALAREHKGIILATICSPPSSRLRAVRANRHPYLASWASQSSSSLGSVPPGDCNACALEPCVLPCVSVELAPWSVVLVSNCTDALYFASH